MKKILIPALVITICVMLTGCSNGNVTTVDAQGTPEATSAIIEVTLPPASEAPQDEPLETLAPEATVYSSAAGITYQSLDTTVFTMQYPTGWERVPGQSSICFREPTGEFPARMVLTVKQDVGNITPELKSAQLASYLRVVIAGFDTYNVVSEPTTGISFLGDDDAFSATYSVTKGEATLKGYVLIAGVGKNLVVFHFRCLLSQYEQMAPVCLHIRDSIVHK